jgi:cytochrome c
MRSRCYIVRVSLGLSILVGCGACSSDPGSADPQERAEYRGQLALTNYGCVSCHTIPGVRGADAMVGPPLDHIAKRVYVAGVLPNSPQNLFRWIKDPPAIDEKTAMPQLRVTDKDAQDIVTYLLTLQ